VQSDLLIQIQPLANPADFSASNNMLIYPPGNNSHSVSFCAAQNFTGTSVPISVTMTGTDSSRYKLSTTQTTAYIVDNINIPNNTNNTNVTVFPTINAFPISVSPNSVTYSASTNTAGTVYYSVKAVSGSSANTSPYMSQAAIKQAVQTGNLQLGGSSGTQSWISVSDPYLRVGSSQVNSGSNVVGITGLNSGTTYSVCMFLENSVTAFSNITCSLVNTSSGVAAKGTFTFNRALTPSEMNSFLCYLQNMTGASDGTVVTSTGDTCNRNGNIPRNPNYNYVGTTIQGNNSTVIYVLSNGTSNITGMRFLSMFTSSATGSNLSSSAVSSANSAIGNGVQITKSTYNGVISLPSLMNSNVTSNVAGYNTNIANTLGLSVSGRSTTTYMVVVRASDPPPTAEQVLNCRNGANSTVFNCSRVIMTDNGVDYSLT
jgi:hypothetical protein